MSAEHLSIPDSQDQSAGENSSIQPSTSSGTLNIGQNAPGNGPSDSRPCSGQSPRNSSSQKEADPQAASKYSRDLREETYVAYIESVAKRQPNLRKVLSFMEQRKTIDPHDCLSCRYFTASILDFTPRRDPSILELETDHAHTATEDAVGQLEATLLANNGPDSFKVMIVEDILPMGMIFLGALLSLDPRVFSHYLDRQRSFPSHDENITAFDYPEMYLYCPPESETSPLSRSNIILTKRWREKRGPMRRLWRALIGHFQRIVWAKTTVPGSLSELHIVLCDSRPTESSVKPYFTYLTQTFPSFSQYRVDPHAKMTAPASCLATVRLSIGSLMRQQRQLSSNPGPPMNQQALGNVLFEYICDKWEAMLLEVEEGISETETPLSGDKFIIESVIQRKHLFGYLRRQLSMILLSAKTARGFEDGAKVLERLKNCEIKLKDWTDELEKVSTSLLGMLSISESTQASFQAIRTKNLSIVAFIFIPISTVASIYGMNVREFSGQTANPTMSSFGISAAAVFAATIALAWLYIFLFSPYQNTLLLWLTAAIDGLLFGLSTGLVVFLKLVAAVVASAVFPVSFVILVVWCALCLPLGLIFYVIGARGSAESLFTYSVGLLIILALLFYDPYDYSGVSQVLWYYDSTRAFRSLRTREWLWERRGFVRAWEIDTKAPRELPKDETECVIM